jgi:hypothetical protein
MNRNLVLKNWQAHYFPAVGWQVYSQFCSFPQKKKVAKKKTLMMITMYNWLTKS